MIQNENKLPDLPFRKKHFQNTDPTLNIVLLKPEIPPNTGTIGRLCAGIQATLHLVGPLGFTFEDRMLKRAGLDYWHSIDVRYYENQDEFFSCHPIERMVFTSRFSTQGYHQVKYKKGDFILFGSETKGIDSNLLKKYERQTVGIPTTGKIRSLNIAVSCGIICFEALRQIGCLEEFGGCKNDSTQ